MEYASVLVEVTPRDDDGRSANLIAEPAAFCHAFESAPRR